MKRFSTSLFERIESIYQRILSHPFLTGLTDGSLDEAAFRFYAIQDSLYLRDFSRGLSILAAKAPDDDTSVIFNESAKNAILVERALHGGFFAHWSLTPQQIHDTPMAPNNLLYTSYLIRVAYERPFHEGLGAFLPCFWIYWEVGKTLEERGSPEPIYQQWIANYASEAFGTVVQQVLNLTDDIGRTLTEDEQERVAAHFVMAARFEYLFWDMGYRQQGWEI